jgi:hypothetical protein
MMPRVVINRCYGGFGLSKLALKELGIGEYDHISRDDPRLVEVVERLGKKANGPNAELRIVEASRFWKIDEYDGMESAEIDWRRIAITIATETNRQDLLPDERDP